MSLDKTFHFRPCICSVLPSISSTFCVRVIRTKFLAPKFQTQKPNPKWNFGAKNALWYKRRACKMLMKLTPDLFKCSSNQSYFDVKQILCFNYTFILKWPGFSGSVTRDHAIHIQTLVTLNILTNNIVIKNIAIKNIWIKRHFLIHIL